MLYISTSNGIFRLDPADQAVTCILGNKHTRGIFRRAAQGYFGIAMQPGTNTLLAASRERLGTPKVDKPTTDCKLHAIDCATGEHWLLATIHDVHDVHQIACADEHVYLTDTGKNRVTIFSLEEDSVFAQIDFGSDRTDVNHINAVTAHRDRIWVGLNNRGEEEAEIAEYPALVLSGSEPYRSVPGLYHSHDLEPWGDTFLMCASHESRVVRADTGEELVRGEGWMRGIAVSADAIWIGVSAVANRSERHDKQKDGWVLRYSHDFDLQEKISVPGAGQINDLVWHVS